MSAHNFESPDGQSRPPAESGRPMIPELEKAELGIPVLLLDAPWRPARTRVPIERRSIEVSRPQGKLTITESRGPDPYRFWVRRELPSHEDGGREIIDYMWGNDSQLFKQTYVEPEEEGGLSIANSSTWLDDSHAAEINRLVNEALSRQPGRSSREVDEEFWNIITYDAALNPKLQGLVGRALASSVEFGEVTTPEYYDVAREIRLNRSLERMEQAVEWCEDILRDKRGRNGQA